MRWVRWLALLGTVSCSCLAAAQSAAPADERPGLVVLGIACDAKDKEWREGLVGFGIEHWLAQALYDSGKVRIIEENPEVLAALHPDMGAAFQKIEKGRQPELDAVARAVGADLVAAARVKCFFARWGGIQVGPLANLRRDSEIKVEICLFDARDGKVTRGEGSGKVGVSATHVGADIPGGRLPFDPTTVAPATCQAVEHAVARLMPGYQPRSRCPEAASPKQPLTFGVLPLALRPDVAQRYPELKQKRVALGIHSRVARAVKGSPSCKLQEINPDVLQALELQWWVGQTGAPPAEQVSERTRDLAKALDWVVYGEVFAFASHPCEKVAGLSGAVSHKVILGVQLRAVNPRQEGGGCAIASGIGCEAGDWEAWKGGEVDFEQTVVGKAAASAIRSAWPALLTEIAARSR